MNDGLRNKETIKGIPMDARQFANMKYCLLIDYQTIDTVQMALLHDVLIRGLFQYETSQPVLDYDLPDRGWTEKNLVIRLNDHGSSFVRQAVVTLSQP